MINNILYVSALKKVSKSVNIILRQSGVFFLTLFIISIAASCTPKEEVTEALDKPNILWISVEDISPDLGCYGDKLAKTPVLDKMASEGIKYTNAIANAPVCAPARSTIITGMFQTSLGSQHMRCKGVFPSGLSYYPQLLQEAGYYCTNNQKEDYNLKYKSDEIWNDSGNKAHWRNRPDKDKPFFSIFNLTLTHESCINSKEKHERVTKDLPDHLRADPTKLILPPYYPDTEKVRELWARHYDNISMMDILVGDLLNQLKEDGLEENTIVIFFSDHGTGSPRHKRWLYDSGIKVPMIVKAPKKYEHLLPSMQGKDRDELVSFIDLAPTTLNLAGVDIPKNMQGRAFLGENLSPEVDYIFSSRDRMDERYDMQRSVRTKDYKYIRYYESYKPYMQYMNTPEKGEIMKEIRLANKAGLLPEAGLHMVASSKPDEELFDLKNDPFELNNLAKNPDYKDKLIELQNAHAKWSDDSKDSGLIPETIMRSWEKESGKSIFEILRERNVPINEIREAALGTDPKKLTKSLNHGNEAVRYWSAVSLGNDEMLSKYEESITSLNSLLDDKVPAVRIAASRALSKIGILEQPLEILIKELSSEDDWVRLLSAQVLDEIGEDARPAESQLQERIDIVDPNKYVIRVANRALNVMNGTNHVTK